MKEITLSNSDASWRAARDRTCLVDDADYDHLTKWRWKIHDGRYAARSGYASGRSTLVLMHRAILDAPKGVEVHHVNGNTLDNRRENLEMIEARAHRRLHAAALVAFQKARQKYPDVKACARCGKPFDVNPRKRKRHKTCSPECAQAMRVDAALKARGVSPSSPR